MRRFLDSIDWEEVAIRVCHVVAVAMILATLLPLAWCAHQENVAMARAIETEHVFHDVQTAYMQRIFNETPPPPPPGPRVRVDVGGVVVTGYQIRDKEVRMKK